MLLVSRIHGSAALYPLLAFASWGKSFRYVYDLLDTHGELTRTLTMMDSMDRVFQETLERS